MPSYKMIIRLNPAAGHDREFNQWYDQHLRHVLAVPGFTSAQRYEVIDAWPAQEFQYCTIFEIISDDLQTTIADLVTRTRDGRMPLPESLNPAVEFEIVRGL